MEKHYAGITDRMLSEIATISDQMSHNGEKGRNNEEILAQFLNAYLPKRYTVCTGKVLAVGGAESGQVDVIIHDRMHTPALMDGHAWSFVPIETVYAVISVKTTLDKSELRDGMKSIESVRRLPREAAILMSGNTAMAISGKDVLRPRAFVFAFKSEWKDIGGFDQAFRDVASEIDDDLRPNGACALDQAMIIRKPYTLETITFSAYALFHFFMFLVRVMDSMPRHMVDLSRYFVADYGLPKPKVKT